MSRTRLERPRSRVPLGPSKRKSSRHRTDTSRTATSTHHRVGHRREEPAERSREEWSGDAAMQQSMSRTRDSIGQSCASAGRAEMTARRMGRAIFIMAPCSRGGYRPRVRVRGHNFLSPAAASAPFFGPGLLLLLFSADLSQGEKSSAGKNNGTNDMIMGGLELATGKTCQIVGPATLAHPIRRPPSAHCLLLKLVAQSLALLVRSGDLRLATSLHSSHV